MTVGALGRDGRALAAVGARPQVALAAPGEGVLSNDRGPAPRGWARRPHRHLDGGRRGLRARPPASSRRRPAPVGAAGARRSWRRRRATCRPAGRDSASGAGALDLAAALAAPPPPRGGPRAERRPRPGARGRGSLLGARPAVGARCAGAPAPGRPARRLPRGAARGRDASPPGWRRRGRPRPISTWRSGARARPAGRAGPASPAPGWSAASLGPASERRLTSTAPAAGVYTLEVQGAAQRDRYRLTVRRGLSRRPPRTMPGRARRVHNERIMTTAPRPPAARDLTDPALYINRELSWLDFNARVLALARDTDRRCSSAASSSRSSPATWTSSSWCASRRCRTPSRRAGRRPRPTSCRARRCSSRSPRGVRELTAEQSRIWQRGAAARAGRGRHRDRPAFGDLRAGRAASTLTRSSTARSTRSSRRSPSDPGLPFPYISGLSLNLGPARARPRDRRDPLRARQGAAAAAAS